MTSYLVRVLSKVFNLRKHLQWLGKNQEISVVFVLDIIQTTL